MLNQQKRDLEIAKQKIILQVDAAVYSKQFSNVNYAFDWCTTTCDQNSTCFKNCINKRDESFKTAIEVQN
jgi:hypothetical protein